MVLKFTRIDRFRALTAVLDVGLGWLAILTARLVLEGLSPGGLVLVMSGGLLYTAGAVVQQRRSVKRAWTP
jgi:hemolysin III